MCFIPHHWARYCLVNTSYVRLRQQTPPQYFVFMTFSILEEHQNEAQYLQNIKHHLAVLRKFMVLQILGSGMTL